MMREVFSVLRGINEPFKPTNIYIYIYIYIVLADEDSLVGSKYTELYILLT